MRSRAGRKLDPEQLVPIPCSCNEDGAPDDPPVLHGPHWVPRRRLEKGGDLRGKVKLDPEVVRHFDL